MQKDLKGYYAKGNIKCIEDVDDTPVIFEIWVRMPQTPELFPSYHYIEQFPGFDVERQTTKYQKSEKWCNGKCQWVKTEGEGSRYKNLYLLDYEKMQKEGLPSSLIIGQMDYAQRSFLLHYGRLIEMEHSFIPAMMFHPKIKFYQKEQQEPYKGCLVFKQTEKVPKVNSIDAKVWLDPSNGIMRRYERIESFEKWKPNKIVMEIIDLKVNPPQLESMSFDFTPPPDAPIRDETELVVKGYQGTQKELEKGGKFFSVSIVVPDDK